MDALGILHAEEGTYFPGDGGPAVYAKIFPTTGMAVDASGNLYLAAGAIRRIDALTGLISTPYGDGPVNRLPAVRLAVDKAGAIYFVGSDGAFSSSLYRLDPGVALPSAVLDTSGQPIPASDVGIDRDGALLVASQCTVLRMNPGEKSLQRIAGTGACGWTGLGDNATATSLGAILGNNLLAIPNCARLKKAKGRPEKPPLELFC